jgi:hypothetical protein
MAWIRGRACRLRPSDMPLLLVAFIVLPILLWRFSTLDSLEPSLPGSSFQTLSSPPELIVKRDAGHSSSTSGGLEPVSCVDLLASFRKNATDPNQHKLFLRYTKDYPQFWISLHTEKFDPVRWQTLSYGRYYEQKLVGTQTKCEKELFKVLFVLARQLIPSSNF